MSRAHFCSQGNGQDGICPAARQTCTFCCSVNLPGPFLAFSLCHTQGSMTPRSTASARSVGTSLPGQRTSKGNTVLCRIGHNHAYRAQCCRCRALDKLPGSSFPRRAAAPTLFITQELLVLAAVRDEP